MKPSNIDVPVFLIFFNRPDSFEKVFEAVKLARPSKLFLACDGAREGNESDVVNSDLCKAIAESIDWECEVYKNYSQVNLGCGMRMYTGIKWAFEHVDHLIVLEDDCVPHIDFFKFCYELLNKYRDDSRINMISGMNHLKVYDRTPNDYFFAGGCCWGWATWKRVWDRMDYEMSFMADEYSMSCVEKLYPYYKKAKKIGEQRLEMLNAGKKLSAWTYQAGMNSALQNQMSIVPKKNLITNIGLTADSMHAVDNIKKLNKKTRQYFNMETYSLEFPLKHPQYVVEDRIYYELVKKKFKTNIFDKLDYYRRVIIYNDFSTLINKVKKKFRRKRR